MKRKIITFIRKHSTSLIVLFLFILALVLRISILGFHDIPAQARTLDSSYNIQMVEWVSQGNFNVMPAYLALGYGNVLPYHPPLLYAVPAFISKILNISPWNAAWLYFSFISALAAVLLYFIGKKMLNEEAGLIAAALYVFPIPAIWISPLYNGMWGLLAGQFLLLLEILLLYSYYEKRNRKLALILGIAIAIQFLIRFSETFIFLPFLFLILLHKFILTKNRKMAADAVMLALPLLMAFIFYAPKLFNVWLKQLDSGFHLLPWITSRLGSIIELSKLIDLWQLQIYVIAFFVLGIYFLIINRKWFWLQAAIYFMAVAVFIPYFVNEAEFFVKFRFFLPLVAYPIAAAGFVFLLKRLKCNIKILSYFMAAIILVASLISFEDFQNKGLYRPLTKEKYEALKWIENNTKEESRIIFLNGFESFNSAFSHRTCFEASLESFKEQAQKSQEENYDGLWCGFFWSEHYKENYLLPYEKSFLKYGYHERITNTSIYNFDYAVYVDDYKEHNNKLELENFNGVYYKNNITVMQNCKRISC